MEKLSEPMPSCITTAEIVLVATIFLTIMSACSEVPVVHTVSTGSHIRLTDEELADKQNNPRKKFVVWGRVIFETCV